MKRVKSAHELSRKGKLCAPVHVNERQALHVKGNMYHGKGKEVLCSSLRVTNITPGYLVVGAMTETHQQTTRAEVHCIGLLPHRQRRFCLHVLATGNKHCWHKRREVRSVGQTALTDSVAHGVNHLQACAHVLAGWAKWRWYGPSLV